MQALRLRTVRSAGGGRRLIDLRKLRGVGADIGAGAVEYAGQLALGAVGIGDEGDDLHWRRRFLSFGVTRELPKANEAASTAKPKTLANLVFIVVYSTLHGRGGRGRRPSTGGRAPTRHSRLIVENTPTPLLPSWSGSG